MGISDGFASKSNVPEGYCKVRVEFTEEESAAIAASTEEYASILRVKHGGGSFVTPVKVEDGLMAQALTGYVEHLMPHIQDCGSPEEMALLVQKATRAQAKAYAVHNLPVYLFQLAAIYDFAGDTSKAREFYRHFLRAHEEFKPDGIDDIFLAQVGFDMTRTIELAKQKSEQSTCGSSGARYAMAPLTITKRQAVANSVIAAVNEVLPSQCAESITTLEVDAAHRPAFECLYYALVLSVLEVVVYEKYFEEDAQDIVVRAIERFFGERPEERLAAPFQDAFAHAHDRYVGIWQLSVPMFEWTEDQMYEEWARTFTSELAVSQKVPCSQPKADSWALATINAVRNGFRRL